MDNLKIKKENDVRRVDGLGRIIIPLIKRKELGIFEGDKLEVYKSGKNIILKKVDIEVSRDVIQIVKAIIDMQLEIDIKVKKINTNFNKNNINSYGLRTIDELGRILIPSEIREELNIKKNDKIKICIKDDMIILIKKR